MRQTIGWSALAAGLAMLAACGGDDGAGGVTPEEAKQLNEISETLDTSADSLTVSEDGLAENAEAPADDAPAENVVANSQ